MRIFVGRDTELRCVDRLVRDNEHNRRMAIIYAATEMGKTRLLEEIYERYRADTAVVFIDIGQEYELPPLVEDMAGQLAAQGVRLSAYRRPTSQRTTLQISSVTANNSPITATFDNRSSSRQEADRLLFELLADIEAAPSLLRHLVLIDQYEKAEAPLRNWLNTSFIPGFLSRNATICVMAGRREPSLNYAQQQRANRLLLPELSEEEIDRWLDAAGVPHTKEDANFLWRGTHGVPGSIYPFIINLMAAQGGAADS